MNQLIMFISPMVREAKTAGISMQQPHQKIRSTA